MSFLQDHTKRNTGPGSPNPLKPKRSLSICAGERSLPQRTDSRQSLGSRTRSEPFAGDPMSVCVEFTVRGSRNNPSCVTATISTPFTSTVRITHDTSTDPAKQSSEDQSQTKQENEITESSLRLRAQLPPSLSIPNPYGNTFVPQSPLRRHSIHTPPKPTNSAKPVGVSPFLHNQESTPDTEVLPSLESFNQGTNPLEAIQRFLQAHPRPHVVGRVGSRLEVLPLRAMRRVVKLLLPTAPNIANGEFDGFSDMPKAASVANLIATNTTMARLVTSATSIWHLLPGCKHAHVTLGQTVPKYTHPRAPSREAVVLLSRVLERQPGLAMQRNTRGWLPLHAVLAAYPLLPPIEQAQDEVCAVILELARAYPFALLTHCDDWLPLHLAIRGFPNDERVIDCILQGYPGAILENTPGRFTPMQMWHHCSGKSYQVLEYLECAYRKCCSNEARSATMDESKDIQCELPLPEKRSLRATGRSKAVWVVETVQDCVVGKEDSFPHSSTLENNEMEPRPRLGRRLSNSQRNLSRIGFRTLSTSSQAFDPRNAYLRGVDADVESADSDGSDGSLLKCLDLESRKEKHKLQSDLKSQGDSNLSAPQLGKRSRCNSAEMQSGVSSTSIPNAVTSEQKDNAKETKLLHIDSCTSMVTGNTEVQEGSVVSAASTSQERNKVEHVETVNRWLRRMRRKMENSEESD